MALRVCFTPVAEADLEGIGDYIARDNPHRALTFVTELRQQCAKVALAPLAYRARPELAEGLRSCAFGNYLVFYRINELELLIVRILHGAVDLAARFDERNV